MRILIVEDSDSICRMIEALFVSRSYEVVAVASGTKALEEALSRVPDAILLDVNLPGAFDGIEVCRRLRANAQTADVPIIMITAMTDEETKRNAVDAGATAFYTKPFSPISLLKEIEALKTRKTSSRIKL